MVEKNSNPRRGRNWGKLLLTIGGALVALLVVVYLVVTSSAFFKAVILPRVGAALKATVEVESASISPFSQVEFRGLKVTTTGAEPVVRAELARVRYSLFKILGGNIDVSELTLERPVIHIVAQPDGTSNLDPLLESDEEAEPPRLNIRNFTISDGIVRQLALVEGGGTNVTELSGLNLSLDQVGNEQTGNLEISSALRLTGTGPEGTSLLEGRIEGEYEVGLDANLAPRRLGGAGTLAITRGEGSHEDLAGLTLALEADMDASAIRQMALRVSRGSEQLGLARAHGTLSLETMEGTLQVELSSIDRNLLNVAGAANQWDFGNTTFNSTNQIQLTRNGNVVEASGTLTGREVSIRQQELATPSINLYVAYEIGVNMEASSAAVRRLDVTGEQDGRQFLRTSLDREMNISWGGEAEAFPEAALRVELANFNVAEWQAVIGTNLASGVVDLRMALASQEGGQLLRTTMDGGVRGLALAGESGLAQPADVTFAAGGTIARMEEIDFPEYSLAVASGGERVFQANGNLKMNLGGGETSARVDGQGVLAGLLRLAPMEGVEAEAGRLNLAINFQESNGRQRVTGTMGVEGFTGRFEDYRFQEYRTGLNLNLEMAEGKVDIQRLEVSFAQGISGGGSLALSGNYDIGREAGRFNFRGSDLNEAMLRPFLAPSLGENQLERIRVNASGTAALDPRGETAIETEVEVRDWVVRGAGGASKPPLHAGLTLEAGMREEVLELKRLLVKLTPTERASNELLVAGRLDMRTNNATPSTVSIRSEGLDVTPYYELFGGGAEPGAESAPTPAEQPAGEAGPEMEPEAMTLPFQPLTAELDIDALYLRDIAISNWTGRVTLRENAARIEPFRMNLNGGNFEFTGNFNVGVPGYVYETAIRTENIPLQPLADSLGDPANRGQLQGVLTSRIEVQGAGVTGPNIQSNLAGGLELNITNMNYQVVGPRLQRIVRPISVVLQLPELTQTPINWVAAQAEIGSGEARLESLGVESEAFFARSSGTITLAPVLTNSTLNLPLELSLRRSLAIKARVAPANTPEDQKYVQLPTFVTVRGTVGMPEPEINRNAILGLIARTAANIGVGSERAEQFLGGLGEALTRQPGGTNETGTNTSPANLLRGLLGRDGATTNAPGTNAPAAEQSPAGGLLRGLGGLLGGQRGAPPAEEAKPPAEENPPR